LDGFSAGCASLPMRPLCAEPTVSQQMPLSYRAGATLLVTNTMSYCTPLLSLLWRPHLPAGWTVTSVLADGSPEMVNGEMVWTGASLPPSPFHVLYFVQVPSSAQGQQQIRNQVEYQMAGMANPASLYASPDPATVYPAFIEFTSIQRLTNGAVQLDMSGAIDTPVRIQTAAGLANDAWATLVTLPPLSGSAQYVDATATNVVRRFYRLISP
jgi:hypothetical protein